MVIPKDFEDPAWFDGVKVFFKGNLYKAQVHVGFKPERPSENRHEPIIKITSPAADPNLKLLDFVLHSLDCSIETNQTVIMVEQDFNLEDRFRFVFRNNPDKEKFLKFVLW